MDCTLTIAEVFALKLAGQRHGTVETFYADKLFKTGYSYITKVFAKFSEEQRVETCDALVEKGLFTRYGDGYRVTEAGKDVVRQLFPHKGDGRPSFKGGF